MTTPAIQRFQTMRKAYTAAIPANKVSRRRRREITWAAALTTTMETVTMEIALGIRRERPPELEQMRIDVDSHLKAANSTSTFQTRAPR